MLKDDDLHIDEAKFEEVAARPSRYSTVSEIMKIMVDVHEAQDNDEPFTAVAWEHMLTMPDGGEDNPEALNEAREELRFFHKKEIPLMMDESPSGGWVVGRAQGGSGRGGQVSATP